MLAIALGIGILGYHLTEDMPWLDALLNASMILGGMGPVSELHAPPGASCSPRSTPCSPGWSSWPPPGWCSPRWRTACCTGCTWKPKHPSSPAIPRLLILSQDHAEYKRLLTAAELPGLSIVATHDPADTIPCGAEFDLLFGEPSLISQAVNALPNLRWAQSTWAGVEPLLRPGMRRDYTLTNVRHVYGPQMSEYVFGYLLLIARGMLSRWQAQQAGRWDTTLPGTLRRKTLGLLGVGSIGAHLAGTARHFSMHVRGYTRFSESCPDVEAYFHGEALSEFAAGLDTWSACFRDLRHPPPGGCQPAGSAAPRTPGWSTSAGGTTVDEAALVAALNAGQLGGAVLDVFQQEPLPPTIHCGIPPTPSSLRTWRQRITCRISPGCSARTTCVSYSARRCAGRWILSWDIKY